MQPQPHSAPMEGWKSSPVHFSAFSEVAIDGGVRFVSQDSYSEKCAELSFCGCIFDSETCKELRIVVI